MALRIEDFKHILKKPSIVLIGSIAQFTIMPLGAFAISKIFNLTPVFAVGLILTGCAPGAMTSNVMSYIAKADTAYSVSLTAVSTLLCPLLTPGLTFLLAGKEMPIAFKAMVLDVSYMIVMPLLAGFLVRYLLKQKIEKILPVFPAISTTFIVFICSLVIALNKNHLLNVTWMIPVVCVLLNVYGMLAGFGVGSVFGMNNKRRRTLSIEIGMQNAGLGAVLAIAYLGSQAAIPAVIFVFVCIITAAFMSAIWQKEPKPEVRVTNSGV